MCGLMNSMALRIHFCLLVRTLSPRPPGLGFTSLEYWVLSDKALVFTSSTKGQV